MRFDVFFGIKRSFLCVRSYILAEMPMTSFLHHFILFLYRNPIVYVSINTHDFRKEVKKKETFSVEHSKFV